MLGNEITLESVVFNLGINAGVNAVVGKINHGEHSTVNDVEKYVVLEYNPLEKTIYSDKVLKQMNNQVGNIIVFRNL
ncbi:MULTISPECIES: hypothetical protein [unclassified Granulicatella]|uniref:hypothetical protein n=1 Tax=unclassified Granulicatella TaxID=2630493 RepID=UPI001ADDAB49|nr:MULTISPECIES: hypothetical protein [unclassified Granulicatella]